MAPDLTGGSMTVDEVREGITGPLCAAYLIGLERAYLTPAEMYIHANDDLAAAWRMGCEERKGREGK